MIYPLTHELWFLILFFITFRSKRFECTSHSRLTESGLTQGLHNTKAKNRGLIQSAATVVSLPLTSKSNDGDGDEDEKENLIGNRESSHEYD